MSYTPSLGTGVINPAEISYVAIALSTNITLYWASSFTDDANVVADVMDVTPAAGSLQITLPNATLTGLGTSFLIRNRGASSFELLDASGGSVLVVGVGEAYFVYLSDTGSVAGTWSNVQFGTGTSSADAATLAGYGLVALSGTLNLTHGVSTKNADYTVLTSDRASVVAWTGGTGTFNLPPAATAGNGFFFLARNSGSGNLTIDPNSSETIDGASTATLAAGDACLVISSGSVWYTVGQGRQVTVTVSRFTKNLTSVSSPYAESNSEAANQLQEFTGTVSGGFTIQVPAAAGIYYVYNNTTGTGTLTLTTASGSGVTVDMGAHRILYCDGTNVDYAQDAAGGTVTQVSTGSGLTGGPITGSGTISLVVPLTLSNGSVSVPTYSFSNSATAGLYLVTTQVVGMAVSSIQIGQWDVSGYKVTGGTSAAPGLAFLTASGVGFYLISGSSMGQSLSGMTVVTYSLSGATFSNGTITASGFVGATATITTLTASSFATSSVLTMSNIPAGAKTYDIPFIAGYTATAQTTDLAVRTYQEVLLGRNVTVSGQLGYISVTSSGAAVILDVLRGVSGTFTSIYSVLPQFDAGGSTLTAGTVSTTTLTAGDVLRFAVTQVGSTVTGKGVTFTLVTTLR